MELHSLHKDKATSLGLPFIPDYTTEFLDEYPEHIHYHHANEMAGLELEFISRFYNIHDGGNAFTDEDFSLELLLKRWNIPDTQFLFQFLARNDLEDGHICEEHNFTYLTTLQGTNSIVDNVHILRNTPSTNLVFECGRNYVSIGYVDLSQLLWGSYRNDNDGVIHFYGYDQAEVTVARSILIYEMLKSEVSDKTILQIWFSSCWDKETQQDFKTFLQNEVPNLDNDLLNKYAHNWKRKMNMTTEFAQSAFAQPLTVLDFAPMSNLKVKDDRMAYGHYCLTGCIFTEGVVVCGNCTMFPDADDNWKKIRSEMFYAVIDMTQIASKLTESDTSLIKFIASQTHKKLSELRGFVQNGKIKCHLSVKTVETNDFRFAGDVKKLEPHVIDWSNVPDFWPRFDFIDFAESCSGLKTLHRFHTINWSHKVYGTSYLDYRDRRDLLETLFRSKIEKLNVTANKVKVMLPNIDRLIQLPLFKMPHNKLSSPSVAADKFGGKYLKYFMTDRNGKVLNHFREKHEIFWDIFLESASHTMICAFSFDDTIQLDKIF